NLQTFLIPVHSIASQIHPQPVGGILGFETSALPRKAPVRTVWTHRGIRLGRKECVSTQRNLHRAAQKTFGAREGYILFQTCSRGRFLQNMLIPRDSATGIYADSKLFLLQRLEKSRIPIPDAYIRRHQVVCLVKPELSLKICLLVIVNAEDDG